MDFIAFKYYILWAGERETKNLKLMKCYFLNYSMWPTMVLTSINVTTSICRERVALWTEGNSTMAAVRSSSANSTEAVDGGCSVGAVSSIDWKCESFACNAK